MISLRSGLLFLFVLGGVGCQSSRIGIDPRGDASIRLGASKAEIIKRLGLPDEVRDVDGGQELFYVFTRGEGLATGVAAYGIRFSIRHLHVSTLSLIVELDENKVVHELHWADPAADLHVTVWPFGD